MSSHAPRLRPHLASGKAATPDGQVAPDGSAVAEAAATTGDDGLLTIRAMCEAYDVTPRALRFYESSELLAPLRRGQARLYGRRDRARLVLILRGKRFGFSLEQIRQLLDLYDPGNRNRAQTAATLAIARERLADMQRQKNELGLAIDDLDRQIAEAEAAFTAGGDAAADTKTDTKTGTGTDPDADTTMRR